MLDSATLSQIKKSLPQGSLRRIQEKASVSYPTVLEFFKGKSQNAAVMNAVISEYNEHLSRVDALNTLIGK